jgi:hypothetical protein
MPIVVQRRVIADYCIVTVVITRLFWPGRWLTGKLAITFESIIAVPGLGLGRVPSCRKKISLSYYASSSRQTAAGESVAARARTD